MKRFLFLVLCLISVPALGQTGADGCDCDLAACLVPLVESYGERGWVGASFAWSEGGDEEAGLAVVEVHPEGPAERAGLEPGETVMAMDGKPFAEATPEEMNDRWQSVRPGQTLTLTVRSKEGERRNVRLRAVELPTEVKERSIGRYVLSLVHFHTSPRHQTLGRPPEGD